MSYELADFEERHPSIPNWGSTRDEPSSTRLRREDADHHSDESGDWISELVSTRRDLGAVLSLVRTVGVSNRLATLREGRERRTLQSEPVVLELSRLLSTDQASQLKVEAFLDDVFQDLASGERFRDTEIVIALLFAIDQSSVRYGHAILEIFANSKATEIAQISRFANRLLGDGL